MSRLQKTILSGIAVAALAASLSGVAQAAPSAFAIAGDNTPGLNINWTGGVGGAWTLNATNAFLRSKIGPAFNANVTVNISPLNGIGAAGYFWHAAYGGFDQRLNGGNFTITDNTTHAVLLSGGFAAAVLHGTNGSSSASVTLEKDSVTYTNPVNAFFPAGTPVAGGSLSIEFTTGVPVVAGAGGCNAFTANDGITFKHS
jgi:hypothetical protein